MTVVEQDAWAYVGARDDAEPAERRLEEVLEVAEFGVRASLRGLLVGLVLLGPSTGRGPRDPGTRRGYPGL